MPDWQERITTETEPALRVEHELRYRLARAAIGHAATWCDLGCGNGVAAADALEGQLPERVVLVDRDERVVETARDTLGPQTTGVTADLTQAGDLVRVREALLDGGGERVVTCFEVIEHLENFVPLVETLGELGRAGDATVLLSVPNDAFWSLENPHHLTMWGDGAFTELRGLLPEDAVVARQASLQGSAVVVEPGTHDVTVSVDEQVVPTHFLAVFGPRRREVLGGAGVAPVDLDGQRRWVRQRESDLAYVEAEARRLREFAETATREREEWRRYIHELEDRLGIPRAGTPEAQRNALPSG
jgi:2-polyprenyl-3-methyl-5-hydroxy-6-metoxy-1,4-benzoquinol methylase